MDLEGVAAPGIAGGDIVAPPGQRELEAVVVVRQTEPGPQRPPAPRRTWPQARLQIIPDARHTGTEPGIADAMVRATDGYA